jgi:hypothetical protein
MRSSRFFWGGRALILVADFFVAAFIWRYESSSARK